MTYDGRLPFLARNIRTGLRGSVAEQNSSSDGLERTHSRFDGRVERTESEDSYDLRRKANCLDYIREKEKGDTGLEEWIRFRRIEERDVSRA